ncbi:MAG TPA: patatin-like phospholipase family protein [Vicinamibacterales bacterium]
MNRIALLSAATAINLLLIAGFGMIARTPAGGPDVVDLQLSMSPGVFTQIVELWGPQTIADVRRSIWLLDFLFPLAYAFLISRWYRSLCETGGVKPYRFVILAPWAAGAADYVENALMLILLGGSEPPAEALVKAMSTAAIVKFVLLTIAAGFTISALLKSDRGRVIRSARYSVVSLLIGTMPLLMLDQGRDLLLGLADPSGGRHQIWFVAWGIVWAFSVWYWSRVILDAEAGPRPSKLYRDWATWLPRVAGFLTLFLPGIACLLAALTATASRGRLVLLAIWCVVFSIAFAAYVMLRRRIPGFGGSTASGYSIRAVEKRSRMVFVLSSLSSAVMLVWLTFFALDAGDRFGAVAILAMVGANTVFLGSLAVFITRARRIPVEIAAFACAAIFSIWNDNHDVRLVDLPAAAAPDLSAVFSSWVSRAPGEAGEPIPVIVAAAEGGGIRAAYWTSLVLHHLADAPEPDVMFPRRLFAISSVSGGSFGAAVYAGLRRDPTSAPPRAQIASEILQERFLAPMVAKLVSGDLLQWFLPMPVRTLDRSSAMETAFAAAYHEHVHHDSMVEPFTRFRPVNSEDVPVMLLNNTSVQLGRRVVASPYRWPLSDVSIEEQDPIDFHALTGRDVSVATAVHNTARFPYISAAGRLRARNGENLGHLVDGGYFENTGAETLLDVLRYLKQSASPLSVRFIVVVMLNSPPELHLNDPARIPWRETASLGEVLSPLRALLQTRIARGDLALRRLREAVEPGDVVEFRVCSDSGLREAPLGWQLSQEMVDVLDANVSQKCFLDQVSKLKEAIRR